MSTERIKQPAEREIKYVLVTLWYGRRIVGWRLAAARKVGNAYQVSAEALVR